MRARRDFDGEFVGCFTGVVNLPVFADFLIAVEAEMNKVSWPTRGELFRGSVASCAVCDLCTWPVFCSGYDYVLWRGRFRLKLVSFQAAPAEPEAMLHIPEACDVLVRCLVAVVLEMANLQIHSTSNKQESPP